MRRRTKPPHVLTATTKKMPSFVLERLLARADDDEDDDVVLPLVRLRRASPWPAACLAAARRALDHAAVLRAALREKLVALLVALRRTVGRGGADVDRPRRSVVGRLMRLLVCAMVTAAMWVLVPEAQADTWSAAPFAACAGKPHAACAPGHSEICMCSDRFDPVCTWYCRR